MKKNVALMALTGILTLASCGQNGTTPTTDSTAPTVSLTANPNSLTTAGTVALTANVTENESTVSKVDFYRDGTLIGTDTTSSDGFTYSDARSTNGSYVYTAKATNSANLVGTSNTQTVTVNIPAGGGGGTTPPPTSSATITITSPANNSTVTTDTVSVAFTTSKPLTDITCSVNGQPGVAAVYGASSGVCTVNVAALNNGQANITVTGKDGTATVSANTIVNVRITPASDPRVVNGISFDANQEISTGEDLESGWRTLGQVVSTPGSPNENTDVYVKGKDVRITFTRPGGATGEIEVFLARTTGTDVPTNDQVQAADRLAYSANGSSYTVNFDSTTLGEMEGVRQWIVFRVNSTELYYRPLVSDNTAPQAAVPDFDRANNANSNIIDSPLDPSIKAARGQIEVFTTNPDIQDKPFGQAPVGASFAQRRPAGIESITYYAVPEAAITAGVSDADLTRRAKAIKAVAGARNTGPVFAATNTVNGNTTTDYRATMDSKALGLNGTYRIYAVTRDKLGNEVASPTFDRVFFDNVGPTITGLGLCDVSALPFVSTDPCNIISDQAVLTVGGVDDAGVGIDPDTYGFNLGGIQLFANGLPTGILQEIEGSAGLYFIDTNRLPDGELAFNFSGLTDYLGNPVDPAQLAEVNNRRILIDNTDPSLEINRPNGGVFTSGEEVSVNSKSTDVTSGVFQNLLFWDDTFFFENRGAFTGEGAAYIGTAVELGRVTADTPTQRRTEITNNQRMTAPFVSNLGLNPTPGTGLTTQQLERQTFYAVAVATDRAGNATMHRVPMTIKPKTFDLLGRSTLTAPSFGRSDGYNQSLVPNFVQQGDASIEPINDNGTVMNFLTNRHNLTLLEAGTYTENVTNGANEALKSVNNYGAFAAYDWNVIVNYLLGGDDAVAPDRVTTAVDTAYAGRIAALRSAAQLAARDNTLSAEERTQLINLGAVATPTSIAGAYNADGSVFAVTAYNGAAPANCTVPAANIVSSTTAGFATGDLAGFFSTGDVEAVVNAADCLNIRPITVATRANIDQFFSDPTLDRKAGLAEDRDVQGWDDVNAPWLKLGDAATPSQGRYTVTTNGLNNLYWNMQDSEASSYPTGGLFNFNGTNYSYVPSLFNAFQLDARYDALAGIVMDTAGSYNYYGECYDKAAPNINLTEGCPTPTR